MEHTEETFVTDPDREQSITAPKPAVNPIMGKTVYLRLVHQIIVVRCSARRWRTSFISISRIDKEHVAGQEASPDHVRRPVNYRNTPHERGPQLWVNPGYRSL